MSHTVSHVVTDIGCHAVSHTVGHAAQTRPDQTRPEFLLLLLVVSVVTHFIHLTVTYRAPLAPDSAPTHPANRPHGWRKSNDNRANRVRHRL